VSAKVFRLTLLGVGAMASPRFAPAGLLVEHQSARVMIDGGNEAAPSAPLDAWLVTDVHAELMPNLRVLASRHGVMPVVADFVRDGLQIAPRAVTHTTHRTYGYTIEAEGKRIVWAPEFLSFPRWARDADLMFAEAAGWTRPIRFARGAGGHAAAVDVAVEAQRQGVRRLVFAHIGRPTIHALDRGEQPPFGEFGADGQVFHPRRLRSRAA
jgi:hypothetical protein